MLLNVLFAIVLAKGVVVKGNARISKDVITSKISEEAFDNEEAYLNDYKSLVGTGFFKKVDFEKCGDKIVVTVDEHPTINQIAFEGNKKMKDEDLVKLAKKFNIESRRPFPLNTTHLAPVIQAMKEEYRQRSVPVEISISTTPLSENRVNVIFNINEEPKMRIKEIRFEGLKAMKAGSLRGAMYTKRYNPVKFFSQDHYFVLERVEYDNRAILEYMRNHGYPNAKVSHTFVQVDPKSQDYRLIFYVEEGDKYTIGDIDTDVERKDLPMDVIKKKIQVKKGQIYNFSLLRSSLFGIQEALSKRGFNTLDFDVAEKQDAEKKTIGVMFKVTKGKNITIRRIHIIGNTRTRHDVILDRIKIREGDRFNRLKMIEAQRNLEGTGFFKEVKVEPTPVDEHAMDITIRLTEARTGSISFNLGYGTLQGMMASVGITDPNIKGTGLLLQTGVSIANKEQNVSFGISNPRFLRRDLNGGFNLLYSRSTMFDQRTEKTIGGEVSLGYELSPCVHQDLSLAARHEKIDPNEKSDENFQGVKFKELTHPFSQKIGQMKLKEFNKFFGLPDDTNLERGIELAQKKIVKRDRTSELYDADFGSHSVTEFGHGITIRPPIFPIGFPGSLSLRMDNQIAGALGTVAFLKNQVTASYNHRVGEYLNFATQISYGLRSKIGNKELRITDCKVLGGQDFHGFDFSGVGPRDSVSGINVGGKEFYLGKVEMSVPIPILKEDFGARLGVYSEFGSCHNSRWKDSAIADKKLDNRDETKIYDQNFCRVSIGCYVKLSTPFGPLRFDFAKPVRVLKDDQGKQLDEERVFMVGYAYQL